MFVEKCPKIAFPVLLYADASGGNGGNSTQQYPFIFIVVRFSFRFFLFISWKKLKMFLRVTRYSTILFGTPCIMIMNSSTSLIKFAWKQSGCDLINYKWACHHAYILQLIVWRNHQILWLNLNHCLLIINLVQHNLCIM